MAMPASQQTSIKRRLRGNPQSPQLRALAGLIEVEFMSMLDDLLKIKEQLDKSRPKDHVDMILSTRCPTETDDGIRVEYKGRWYLILHWVAVRKIESQCQREVLKPSPYGYTASPMFGIPVVENEELVREILSFVHSQPDNGFELADKAREWVFDSPPPLLSTSC